MTDSAEFKIEKKERQILSCLREVGNDWKTLDEIIALTKMDRLLVADGIGYLLLKDLVSGTPSAAHQGQRVYGITKKGITIITEPKVEFQGPKVVTPISIITKEMEPSVEPTQLAIGRPEGQSEESIEIDKKIKELYPGMKAEEIANHLKLTYGSVRGRINRMRQDREITEYVEPARRGGDKVPCDVCGKLYGNRGGLSSHKRIKHGIKGNLDEKYAVIDKKIKESYPAKGPTEIAENLGIAVSIVSGRLTKLHNSGEVTEYWTRKQSSTPPSRLPPLLEVVQCMQNLQTPQKEQITESVPKVSNIPINVGQFLKVVSDDKVAIVNATLEVIDERGCEYEITINRTNKGLILSEEHLQSLLNILETSLELNQDMIQEADDEDHEKALGREIMAAEAMIAKIRKEARMPEEKPKL